ncbi:MAG: hypothetical protein WCT46_03670 [Candidatus Gracilibacteria bacterium]
MTYEAQENQEGYENDTDRAISMSLFKRGLLGKQQEMPNNIGNRENAMNPEAANNTEAFKLAGDLAKVEKAMGQNYEISSIRDLLLKGKISTKEAEEQSREAIIEEAEKKIRNGMDKDEDEILEFTKGCTKFMQKLPISELAGEMERINESEPKQAKIKKEIAKLKSDSPRAFKAYILAIREEKKRGTMERTREEILKDTKTTYARAIKNPLAVQGEFFAKVEKKEIGKEAFEKTLNDLEAEHKEQIDEYNGLIDKNVKIFGKKPAEEFKKWIKTNPKNFKELRNCLDILKTEYIPQRQKVQEEFESLPDTLTKPYQEKWGNELGYSERRALIESLHQVEKNRTNPLAQEYLKLLTDSPKEIAPKEWPKMLDEFLQNDFEDQEALLKVFKLTELKQRRKLTDRFEKLPKAIRKTNDDFFTLDREEKIKLLGNLEKDNEGEDSLSAWGDVIDTEEGLSVFREKLSQIMQTDGGTAAAIASVLAQKTIEDQRVTGKITAEDRQITKVKAKAGNSVAEKLGILHDATDGDVTVDGLSNPKEEKIHTMDISKLNKNAMDKDELSAVKRELLVDRKVTNDVNNRYSRAKFIQREGNDIEMNLANNMEQRNQVEDVVMQKVIQALLMTVEALSGGRAISDTSKIEALAEKKSEKLLKVQRELTRRRFGVEGLKKAA